MPGSKGKHEAERPNAGLALGHSAVRRLEIGYCEAGAHRFFVRDSGPGISAADPARGDHRGRTAAQRFGVATARRRGVSGATPFTSRYWMFRLMKSDSGPMTLLVPAAASPKGGVSSAVNTSRCA